MDEKLFTGHGVEIFKRGDNFFIRYDVGEIVIQMREDEITEEQALKAQKSEKDAYEVILSLEE